MKRLTPKQEQFCQLYVKYSDASRAYRESYDCSRSKPATVWRRAKEMLDNGKVAARIAELQDRLAVAMDITPDRVLKELARIAFANLRRVLDEDGNLLPPKQWPRDVAPAIQSIKFRDGKAAEVKLWPKTAALESLSKHLGLFERDNRQRDIPINLTITYSGPDDD